MSPRLAARLFLVEALRALARNKVRSALAMLGNLVGVASVIWVVAIGRASANRALAELDKLGDNLVWIEAGSRNVNGVRTGTHGMTTLTARDAAAIRAEVPLITRVSENVDGNVQVAFGGRNWNTHFRGVSPEYVDVKRWELARGGFFTADDLARAERVVVIGETVRAQLFGDDDPVGQVVRVRGSLFEVVGLFAPKGQSATGQDQDDTLVMPWTTAQRRVLGKDVGWLDDILCSAASVEDIPAATAQVTELLRERHRIRPGDDDDFNVRHPEDLINARIKSAQTFQYLLVCLASIALVVGGISIMNLMLASVVQRTREIGVRLAVGARPAAIHLQFLGEAVMLTLIGGGLGVGAAALGAPAIGASLGTPVHLAPTVSALAVAFSIAVGVVFGFYPATRAARLDPIAALRHE